MRKNVSRLFTAFAVAIAAAPHPLLHAQGLQAGAPLTTVTLGGASASDGRSYVVVPENRPTGIEWSNIEEAPKPSTEPEFEFDEQTMIRVSDLRPGMKGYGLTVFSGIEPVRFEAEVIGVGHGFFAGDDLILCMLEHPVLKDIGVVAGMSGSPVYIEGKLAGAVAYGWGFSKEPLAGVTPIESMLKVYNSTHAGTTGTASADGSRGGAGYSWFNRYMEMRRSLALGERVTLPGLRPHGPRELEVPSDLRQQLGVDSSVKLMPLSAPIFMSASSPQVVSLAQELFGGADIVAAPAGMAGAGAGPSADSENSPGGPVADLAKLADEVSGGYALAIPLVEGDMSMAGVGTVSWRHGNKLIAFGHPMFEYGIVSYPMAAARVNTVIRNLVRPFKLGESVGQIGVVRQDRLPAIGGVLGEKADMFPVRVRLSDAGYRGARDLNYRVWNDRDMGAMYTMVTLFESLSAVSGLGGDKAILYKYSMAFDDGTSIAKENYSAAPGAGMMAAFELMSDLGAMSSNPYKRILPSSVEFDAAIASRLPQAQIVAATLDRADYRPGSEARVTVDLLPYRQEKVQVGYRFQVPENLPDGQYLLTVGSSSVRTFADYSVNPGAARVFDFDSLARVIRRNFPANKVYITLTDQDTGLTVEGQDLPKLPGSIITTLAPTAVGANMSPMMGNYLVDADIATTYEVSGAHAIALTVSRKRR